MLNLFSFLVVLSDSSDYSLRLYMWRGYPVYIKDGVFSINSVKAIYVKEKPIISNEMHDF